jgi:flagellar hook assembly protein FlgD
MSDWDGWAGPDAYDFDVYLYDPTYNPEYPSHSLIDLSFGSMRQEMIGCDIEQSGTYILEVRSYSGSGSYFFDLSAGPGTTVILEPDLDDYMPRDVAITGINVDSEIPKGLTVNVGVVVENEGKQPETTTVTLTDAGEPIDLPKAVELEVGESKPVTFQWDTTGASIGEHVLHAELTSVPGEIDLADNSADRHVSVVIGVLEVAISIPPGPHGFGDSIPITVGVTDDGSGVEGAEVDVTITTPKGKNYLRDGVTDANGEVGFLFKPKRNDGSGTYHVAATASKQDYGSGEGDETTFEVGTSAAPASAGTRYATWLGQAFPTPGNPEIWIPFTLSQAENVIIRIHDATGKLIRTLDLGHVSAGSYIEKSKAAHWDGRNAAGEEVSNGVYFCTIQVGRFTATRKTVVAK